MNQRKFVTLIGFLVTAFVFGVGQFANAAVSDVSSGFTIVRGALVFNRSTNTYDSQVTITNKSGTTSFGPVQVVVTTVPIGVSLANGQGMTEDGKPFIIFVPVGGQISTGQAVNGILKFHNPNRLNFSAVLNVRAESSTTVPDPGAAGKLTLAGIDINNNGVRDDVEVYIETKVTNSAKHREALKSVAIAAQRELLAQNKSEAIQAAIAGVRSIECLSYLGLRKQGRWREVMAVMVNTELRLQAMDLHNDRINGEVFQTLADSQRRSACTFNVEALPN